jgi:hypothetical protein
MDDRPRNLSINDLMLRLGMTGRDAPGRPSLEAEYEKVCAATLSSGGRWHWFGDR